jgi:hypothetical protein
MNIITYYYLLILIVTLKTILHVYDKDNSIILFDYSTYTYYESITVCTISDNKQSQFID